MSEQKNMDTTMMPYHPRIPAGKMQCPEPFWGQMSHDAIAALVRNEVPRLPFSWEKRTELLDYWADSLGHDLEDGEAIASAELTAWWETHPWNAEFPGKSVTGVRTVSWPLVEQFRIMRDYPGSFRYFEAGLDITTIRKLLEYGVDVDLGGSVFV